MIEVIYEYGTEYRPMRERQIERRRKVIAGEAEPVIICTEHRPVYTLGKHGHEENLLHLPDGVECIRIERGGDITWHGPGQITLYPIVNLHTLRLGVKDYITILEQAVIDTLALYNIEGQRIEGATGVWIERGTPRERKICAIGVSISRGVTMHGLALNVTNSLEPYRAINPCGFIDKGVTSIKQELVQKGLEAPELKEVAKQLTSRLIDLIEIKTH